MRRLLIVEDNLQFAQSIKMAVQDLFEVEICVSVPEALLQIQAKPVDVVLSDYNLVGSTGLELVAHLRSMVSPPRIVMMTAFADKDMAIAALNYGVSRLLEKPFGVAALREALGEVAPEKHPTPALKFDPVENSVIWKGRAQKLTPSEYLLLSYLASQADAWIAREDLEKYLRDDSSPEHRPILDTHIYNLRKKIPELTTQLRVVRGRGYSLKNLE